MRLLLSGNLKINVINWMFHLWKTSMHRDTLGGGMKTSIQKNSKYFNHQMQNVLLLIIYLTRMEHFKLKTHIRWEKMKIILLTKTIGLLKCGTNTYWTGLSLVQQLTASSEELELKEQADVTPTQLIAMYHSSACHIGSKTIMW